MTEEKKELTICSKTQKKGINAVILAGGLSSRLGMCKSKLRIQEIDLLRQSFDLLSEFCDEVVISCKKETAIEGYPCIYDTNTDYAPMIGINEALKHFKSPVFVMSCDLPFMNSKTIEKLINVRKESILKQGQYLTCYANEDTNYIEALVAIYEYKSVELLEDAIIKEHYSLRRIFHKDRRYHVLKDETKAFFNINYIEDLAYAENLMCANKS